MTTHSQKKLDDDALIAFRNRFNLPLSDPQATQLEFFKPAADSAELRYLHRQRARLGGYLPQRQSVSSKQAGEVATYEELSAAIGRDVRERRSAMHSALRRIQNRITRFSPACPMSDTNACPTKKSLIRAPVTSRSLGVLPSEAPSRLRA